MSYDPKPSCKISKIFTLKNKSEIAPKKKKKIKPENVSINIESFA